MITLGQLIGVMIQGNPNIVIMPTTKLSAGVPVEPTGIKIAVSEGRKVIILTI